MPPRPQTDLDVEALVRQLKGGDTAASSLFPHVDVLANAGPGDATMYVAFRVAKSGLPVRMAGPDEPAHLIKQVNDFETYAYSSARLADALGTTAPKARAIANHLGLTSDLVYSKLCRLPDGSRALRYSEQARRLIAQQLPLLDQVSI